MPWGRKKGRLKTLSPHGGAGLGCFPAAGRKAARAAAAAARLHGRHGACRCPAPPIPRQVHHVPADAPIAVAPSIAGDAVSKAILRIQVQQLARVPLARSAQRQPSAPGYSAAPRRAVRRTGALCSAPTQLPSDPPQRPTRRGSSIASTSAVAGAVGLEGGRELLSARPDKLSASKRLNHFAAVCLAASVACAPDHQQRSTFGRRCGMLMTVPSPPDLCGRCLDTLSFPDHRQVNNLLEHHS